MEPNPPPEPRQKRRFPFLGRGPATEKPRKLPFTEYLHVLDTYGVSWNTQKVARDTWQNFFDANGYSLDQVTASATPLAGGGSQVTIAGPSEYDYRYLLHTGGTTKADDVKAAGGFGEGAKIAALVALRDLGAKEVIYGTGNVKVTFYLDSVRVAQYPQPVRGLFTRVESAKHSGSYFQAEFPNANTAQDFLEAKDLFYHKDNPDFKSPTVNNVAGGFSLHVGSGGNLYEAGQRRHLQTYDKKLEWNNVPDVTLWTGQKTFEPDRDRGDIPPYEVEKKAIPPIVAAMETDEIKTVITNNPDFWYKTESSGTGEDLLKELCKQYRDRKGETIEFPPEYVASSLFTPEFLVKAMQEAGYTLCHYKLADIGMETVADRFKKLQEHLKIEPTEQESQRVNILRKGIKDLLGEDLEDDVWLYSKENEKSIFHGQHQPGLIWLAQEIVHGDFPKALSTILHERDHASGVDQSAEFSYALTDTLTKVIAAMIKNPDLATQLQRDWDQIQFPDTTTP